MRIVLNGGWRDLPDQATVASAVETTGVESSAPGLAVAVDGEVLPRGEWSTTVLEAGQRVEVLHAVQGG